MGAINPFAVEKDPRCYRQAIKKGKKRKGGQEDPGGEIFSRITDQTMEEGL